MERKIKTGEAIDISTCVRTDEGAYHLIVFTEEVDYCDAKTEEWIWSIGEHLATGQILAATDTRFYNNPLFKCLWLR